MKKERWTEEDVLALPTGEHDYFERKGGDLLSDSGYREKIAQALSAFANSGGGHLIIGVKDDCTVDGVPDMKGRTLIRDWIEQLIPNLLNYSLQDFRVHEVEPAAQTLIPDGRVVLVIDVGDSRLAPHQSESNKVYYHRSGGRSEPAPHHYLKMLWGRDGYPSQRIAYSWLNFVIAPLLGRMEVERKHVEQMRFGWQRFGSNIQNIIYLDPRSAVEVQFLRFYPEIELAIQNHDSGSGELAAKVRNLVEFIETSSLLADRFVRATSSDGVKEIRRKNPYLNSKYNGSDAEMIQALFGNASRESQFSFLTELIVNQRGDLDLSMVVWPLWNVCGESFREIVKIQPILHYWEAVGEAATLQIENINSLTKLVETTRHEIAFRFGEPYEDEGLAHRVG